MADDLVGRKSEAPSAAMDAHPADNACGSSALRRLDLTQAEIVQAMRDLVEHADDTLWLTDTETVFERLAYLYEVAGGERVDLVREFPESFDIEVGNG